MNLQESIRNDLNKLNESNDFFKYVESFYGDGEIYARYFTNDDGSEGASMEEITKAIDTLTNDDKWSWGGGDSMDREKVRDIMLANRETDHDDLNKITEAEEAGELYQVEYEELPSGHYWLKSVSTIINSDGFLVNCVDDLQDALDDVDDIRNMEAFYSEEWMEALDSKDLSIIKKIIGDSDFKEFQDKFNNSNEITQEDVINFKSKKITNLQVEQWLGSDLSRKGIIEILRDIANGDYPADMLKRDITSYDLNEGDVIDFPFNKISVEPDPDQEGYFYFMIGDEGSDISYPSKKEATRAAIESVRVDYNRRL
jgi:hypothetical protein